jgi:hypothetical protein
MADRHQAEAEMILSTQPGKRPWVSPTIEEIDFRAAANGPGSYRPTDINTYSS